MAEAISRLAVLEALTPTARRLIVLRIAQYYGVLVREMTDHRHSPRSARKARECGMWAFREIYRVSWTEAATPFGRNVGGTARSAWRTVEARRATDEVFRAELDNLVTLLVAEVPPPPA